MAGLGHVARKGGAVTQLDGWRIERLICPITGKSHAEDQENVLGRINVEHTSLPLYIGLTTGVSRFANPQLPSSEIYQMSEVSHCELPHRCDQF